MSGQVDTAEYTMTGSTGASATFSLVCVPEPDPQFPWHWDARSRRLFVECVEAAERYRAALARRAG